MEAMAAFWTENLPRIKEAARQYARMKCNSTFGYTVEDMTDQVLLDLPEFDFTDDRNIAYSLRRSFFHSALGGWSDMKERHSWMLNRSHELRWPREQSLYVTAENGDELCVLDIAGKTEPSEEDKYLAKPLFCLEDLAAAMDPYLTPSNRRYLYWKLHGHTNRESARRTGRKSGSPVSAVLALQRAAAEHGGEILDFLRSRESDSAAAFEKLVAAFGAEYLERHDAYNRKARERTAECRKNPEYRERKAISDRAWYARIRADPTTSAALTAKNHARFEALKADPEKYAALKQKAAQRAREMRQRLKESDPEAYAAHKAEKARKLKEWRERKKAQQKAATPAQKAGKSARAATDG